MSKQAATKVRPTECCPSVLAAPLDAADAAELAERVQRAGRPGPAAGPQHPRRLARGRGLRLRLRRAPWQEPAHRFAPPQDPERGRSRARRPAGQVGLVLAQPSSSRPAPRRNRWVRRVGYSRAFAHEPPESVSSVQTLG